MSDSSVAALLRSKEPLVVVEAPAGCGKTFQGAAYAGDVSHTLEQGRLLILTHTHGACGVFAERTRGLGRVDIRTLDSLIGQVASVYRRALGLPDNLSTWAYQNDGAGFDIMANKVAGYLERHPIVREALARRYPLVICDEHQDASEAQHRVIMALRLGGAHLRIFGDPLQAIFASGGAKSDKAMSAALGRWDTLKAAAAFDELDHPHRWREGSTDLGRWTLVARTELKAGRPIPLTGPAVRGLSIVRANNTAQARTAYQVSRDERRPIDAAVAGQAMVLAASNDRVRALSAFWGRRIPVWEGHTRSALADLVRTALEHEGRAEQLAQGVLTFASAIGIGFSPSSHGDRLVNEVREGCSRPARGKPGNIQRLARHVLQAPNHQGVAGALNELHDLIEAKAEGFEDIKIVHRSELRDAIRLKTFSCPEEGYAEIARRRSHALPTPPARTLSTIHKAKGLECDNAVLIAGDKDQFGGTYYARCKAYVAISRARKSLTIVVSRNNPSPLFQMA